MDDSGATRSSDVRSSDVWASDVSLSLVEGALLIGGHCRVEQRLFELTGRWSVDAAGGRDPLGLADFLATQSAIHGWRLAEWERRSPRSIGEPEAGDDTGWDLALGVADSIQTDRARLACWYQVLAVHLAARYRRHLAVTSRAADAGVARWLSIAQSDVLDGVAHGATVAARHDTSDDSGPPATEVADAVAACLVPLLEHGF